VYRPPGARGAPSTFKLHDDDDDEKKTTGGSYSVNASGGGGPKKEEPLSKTALKNKKKREAAKKRKEEDEEAVGGGDPDAGGHQGHHAVGGGNNGYQGAAGLLFDAEKEKKIRKIMDKIKAIEQLKLMQAWGTHICVNVVQYFCYMVHGIKRKQLCIEIVAAIKLKTAK
jgi:hypothetical protein